MVVVSLVPLLIIIAALILSVPGDKDKPVRSVEAWP
jgi:hypothetical protein